MSITSKILTTGAVASALLLTNCASIFNRSSQPVSVTSNPAGLAFKVTDQDGATVASGTTPGNVRLDTSPSYFRPASYTFSFSNGSKALGTRQLNAGMSGWYAGNILVGGLVGMLIVDPLTGSMYTLPNDVAFEGQGIATLDHPTSGSLAVATIDQLTSEQRASLVSL